MRRLVWKTIQYFGDFQINTISPHIAAKNNKTNNGQGPKSEPSEHLCDEDKRQIKDWLQLIQLKWQKLNNRACKFSLSINEFAGRNEIPYGQSCGLFVLIGHKIINKSTRAAVRITTTKWTTTRWSGNWQNGECALFHHRKWCDAPLCISLPVTILSFPLSHLFSLIGLFVLAGKRSEMAIGKRGSRYGPAVW